MKRIAEGLAEEQGRINQKEKGGSGENDANQAIFDV